MIPGLVKRIVVTTAVVSAIVCIYLALVNMKAALAFIVSVVWMLVNFSVWGKLITVGTADDPAKKLKVLGLVALKLGLLIFGFVMLNLAAPLTRPQALAVVGGITMVFVIAGLKVLGARLTGRDVFSVGKLPARRNA